jgi:hypothetical protein
MRDGRAIVTDRRQPTGSHSVGHMYALLLLTTILWGGGPVAGKIALRVSPRSRWGCCDSV